MSFTKTEKNRGHEEYPGCNDNRTIGASSSSSQFICVCLFRLVAILSNSPMNIYQINCSACFIPHSSFHQFRKVFGTKWRSEMNRKFEKKNKQPCSIYSLRRRRRRRCFYHFLHFIHNTFIIERNICCYLPYTIRIVHFTRHHTNTIVDLSIFLEMAIIRFSCMQNQIVYGTQADDVR